MAVRIADGVADRVVTDRGGYLQAQVRSDLEVARRALERAAEEIATLDAGWESAIGLHPGAANTPNYVSQVSDSPIGPYIYIDAKHLPDDFLRRYPQIVADHLIRAGVTDALVTSPDSEGPLDDLAAVPGAVTLHARPSRHDVLPGTWLNEAVAWVRDGASGSALLASAGPVQLSTTPHQAAELLDTCDRSGSSWLLASDDLRRVRAAHGEYQLSPELVVAAGGPDAGDRELAVLAEELRALARRLAPDLAYAFIAMEPDFRDLVAGPHLFDATEADHDPVAMARMADVIVPDVFWYQVLSAGHLKRLGRPPEDARPLPGDRMELTLGDAGDWVAGTRMVEELRASGRQRLGRLLAARMDAIQIWDERQAF
jgi:hypothetical protein